MKWLIKWEIFWVERDKVCMNIIGMLKIFDWDGRIIVGLEICLGL